MAQLTVADLKDFPKSYQSPRDIGDVLIGEDAARPLIEASSTGNDMALQRLLSLPQYIKIILETPHRIYKESRPSQDPNKTREVTATPMLNLEWAFTVAAENGQAAVVSTLMAFAIHQRIDAYKFISKSTMNKVIASGHAAVFRALASVDPNIINFPTGHGTLALYEAVRRRQINTVAVLLELGADPLHPVEQTKDLYTYNSSLMSLAAMTEGPRMTEMLLEHGTPIASTGALHTAARWGQLDTMRLLMQHGADLNEGLSNWSDWTPMHFAASKGQIDAMTMLEHSGARSDLKDRHGKTPAQLLGENSTAQH
jgi:ankyrin repeat protein